MSLKIVRNDITKMNTEAIVNTANDQPTVGTGCDSAVYQAAGYEELLRYRTEKIGSVPEGEAFLTPGFALPAKYIIHAVSPYYVDGSEGEEEKLRACYRNSLRIAKENRIRSIAFPLISTGGFGYPKEEGMRIAVDEINSFLLGNEMEIYLVVFDEKATSLGEKLYPDLEAYIDQNYVEEKRQEEYGRGYGRPSFRELLTRRRKKKEAAYYDFDEAELSEEELFEEELSEEDRPHFTVAADSAAYYTESAASYREAAEPTSNAAQPPSFLDIEDHERKIEERIKHLSDTFSEYLMYLIEEKGLKNSEVYKRAIVDRKVFSKIKNDASYHPQKLTALCLCVGAKLNLDESRDLLARAGYALSPCDKTDIIFSYFIENEIYDMIELDIQLEEHGLPCIIS